MREQKFRVWDKENKIMLEVVKIEWLGKTKIVTTKSFYDDRPKGRRFEQNNIVELELMQFTGLKDKNGKEIYEGDIMAYRGVHGNLSKGRVVKWNEIKAGFDWTDHNKSKVIIGNKFENPELLR